MIFITVNTDFYWENRDRINRWVYIHAFDSKLSFEGGLLTFPKEIDAVAFRLAFGL